MKGLMIVLAFILVLSVVAGCTSSSPASSPAQPLSRAAPAAPGTFKLSTLAISPPEANPGIQVMISARVTNTGENAGTYTPKLRIDNLTTQSLPTYLYLRDTTLNPGANQLLAFLVGTDNPGKYRVTWGDLNGEFSVVESTDSGNVTVKIAPDFSGVDVVTGKKISLSQYKGNIVLFSFVNYGCDPSINNVVSRQLIAIRELQKQRKDFVPISVFCGCCPEEVLRDFAKKNDLSWPWILDSDNSVARKYGTYLRKYGYPTLVYIDKEQQVYDFAGYSGAPQMSGKLDEILGKGLSK